MKQKILLFIMLSACLFVAHAQNSAYLMVGTYTSQSESKGIYLLDFDKTDGSLSFIKTFEDYNPEYFAFDAEKNILYVCNENIDADHKGVFSIYKWDKQAQSLTLLQKVNTVGNGPCHISLDKSKKLLGLANYGSGDYEIYKIKDDGLVEANPQFEKQEGKGPNPSQKSSHVHSIFYDPSGKFAFVSNLGTDKISIYKVKPSSKKSFKKYGEIAVPAGYGPRHLVFSAKGDYLYALCELQSHLLAFKYHKGHADLIQDLEINNIESPDSDRGSSAICLSPNGKFLYASNRGKANNIVSLQILSDGKLKVIDTLPVKAHPRDFMISEDGKYLVSASRDENAVESFNLQPETGKFGDKVSEISIPKPITLILIHK